MKQITKKKIAMLLVVCMLFTLLPTMALAESSTTATSETAPAFQDVSANAYYYNAVQWAAQNHITGGVSKIQFAPDMSCTRAQIVTFLWRAAGRPEPTTTTNPFVDVSEDDYYYKAVLWAVEKGITAGTSATTFSPDATCTRAQAVTFIYRSEKANGGGFTGAWMFRLPFTDVPECYYEAVAWCYMQKITGGTGDTTFSPDAACTRGQIVAMLYRYWQATQTEEQKEEKTNDIGYSGGGGSYAPSTSSPSIVTYCVTVTNGTGSGDYEEGETVTITANTAPDGQHFTGWTVEKGTVTLADSSSSSAIFIMPAEDVAVKANYETDSIVTYTITTTASAYGTISPANPTVNYGDSKTFTIAPNTGYKVKDVLVDDVSIGAKTSYEFKNVTANHKIEVTFAIDTFTITASVNNSSMGTITETATVNYGDSKTFTIAANTGYHIVDVEVDGVCKGAIASYTFENVNETHTIKATFAIDTFTITASVNKSSMGTITETANVNYGDSKTFTIAANIGYHIVDVEVDGVSKGAITSYTFENVKETHTIKATFAINPYSITATAGANGTITESARLNAGDSKTFTMTANTGYGVKDVKVDGTSVGPVTSYTFENVNENHTIEVEFGTATTVTTAQQFREAVAKDGIVILANDITLDDNGNVEISKNVIIHGEGHTVTLAQYSGDGWSRTVSILVEPGALLKVVNSNFEGLGWFIVQPGAVMEVYASNFEFIDVQGDITLSGGVVSDDLGFGENANLLILDYTFRQKTRGSFLHSLRDDNFVGSCSIQGGTFYFDISSFLDANKYKATKTKDADNVDIWVVTEK